jgi:hypothetical protein
LYVYSLNGERKVEGKVLGSGGCVVSVMIGFGLILGFCHEVWGLLLLFCLVLVWGHVVSLWFYSCFRRLSFYLLGVSYVLFIEVLNVV